MKAGIYQRRDTDRLIYVAKDRSVRAFESCADTFRAVSTEDWKVSTQQKGQVVTWPVDIDDPSQGNRFADRVADAPNGCTDHAQALFDYRLEQRIQATPPTGEGYNHQLAAYAAGVVENHLAAHPPEQRVEQPDTDLTSPEPATGDFAERAQGQVDTVVAYERAKRDLQFMLYAEQIGVVRWDENDWTILDVNNWNELNANPPKLLPVLPEGFVASRSAAYVANRRIGMIPKFHSGGLAGEGPAGETPTVLDCCTTRTLGKRRELGMGYRTGPTTAVRSFEVTGAGDSYQKLAKDLTAKYRKVFRPSELPRWEGCCSQTTPVNHYPELLAQVNMLDGPQATTTEQMRVGEEWPPTRSYPSKCPPMPKGTKRHGAVSVEVRTTDELAVVEMIESGQARIVGKQSARKHRRAGHPVFWFAPLGSRVVIV